MTLETIEKMKQPKSNTHKENFSFDIDVVGREKTGEDLTRSN